MATCINATALVAPPHRHQNMLKQIVLVFGIALVQCYSTAAIECYTCNNTSSLPDCKNIMKCPTDSVCASEYTTINGTRLYNLGCRDLLTCPLTPTATPGSPSIVGRSVATSANCSECCHSNYCNRQICQDPDPQCADDKSVDCASVGTITNICDDASHIKPYCRRFCGFCNTLDGGWSHWSQWSVCSVTCGNGTRARSRTCSDPPPTNGGTDCPGVTHEQETCSKDLCPINGGWSTWSDWGACSASCDLGLKRRDRTCSNPRPDRNGEHCYGSSHEDMLCFPGACANGGWSSWGAWGACTKPCGGIKTRSRLCNSPAPSMTGQYCAGDSAMSDICENSTCKVHGGWSAWSSWGSCSVSCDIGIQRRDRACSKPYPSPSGDHCYGESRDDRLCFPGACSNGSWSSWGAWGACTRSCGGGVKTRSRDCDNPAPSITGKDCGGDPTQSEACSISPCHAIGFSVTYPKQSPTSFQLTFTTTITNAEGSFNTATGVFTCKTPGYYYFSASLLKSYGYSSKTFCQILKNGSGLVQAFTEPGASPHTGNTAAVASTYVHLATGDTVTLAGCSPISSFDHVSSYSGFLVTPDAA